MYLLSLPFIILFLLLSSDYYNFLCCLLQLLPPVKISAAFLVGMDIMTRELAVFVCNSGVYKA